MILLIRLLLIVIRFYLYSGTSKGSDCSAAVDRVFVLYMTVIQDV